MLASLLNTKAGIVPSLSSKLGIDSSMLIRNVNARIEELPVTKRRPY